MRWLTVLTVMMATRAWAETPATPEDVKSKGATSACRADGGPLTMFAIGSSSMQIILGPILEKRFGKQGLIVGYLGRSATGLARPDYWDWPLATSAVLLAANPDVFVVDLGSNDGQGLRHADGSWTRVDKEASWRVEYGKRVDAMLAQASGKDHQRAVIWIGPAAHSVDEKRARGRVVNEVIKERIAAFDGRAWFIDLFARSSTDDGGALTEMQTDDGPKPLRTADGFHLTRDAVLQAMYAPLAKILGPCAR